MSHALMGSNHIDNNDKYEKISKYVGDLDMIIMNADAFRYL
jgi:hypothetical protein